MIKVVNSRYGRILVNPKDIYVGRSLIEYGEFSEGEAHLFKTLLSPSSIVVDVGANIGAHTLVFAKYARHVLAIEPQRHCYNMLCGTMALNDIKNVDALRVAASDQFGTVKCPLADQNFEANFGCVSMNKEGIPENSIEEVPCIPLDYMCNFLKIDVEGMEVEVLRGAEPMIRSCKPILYVENDRKDKAEELCATIKDLGYDAYWHLTYLYNPNNFNNNLHNHFPDEVSVNMICVPESVEFPLPLDKVISPHHPKLIYRLDK